MTVGTVGSEPHANKAGVALNEIHDKYSCEFHHKVPHKVSFTGWNGLYYLNL